MFVKVDQNRLIPLWGKALIHKLHTLWCLSNLPDHLPVTRSEWYDRLWLTGETTVTNETTYHTTKCHLIINYRWSAIRKRILPVRINFSSSSRISIVVRSVNRFLQIDSIFCNEQWFCYCYTHNQQFQCANRRAIWHSLRSASRLGRIPLPWSEEDLALQSALGLL